jgi:hypothetical protein
MRLEKAREGALWDCPNNSKQQYRNRVLAALPKAGIDPFTPYLLNLLRLIEAEATLTEKGQHYLSLAKEEVQRISEIAHDTPGWN